MIFENLHQKPIFSLQLIVVLLKKASRKLCLLKTKHCVSQSVLFQVNRNDSLIPNN